jgi:chromosomal replication initiation ATPase DnaA
MLEKRKMIERYISKEFDVRPDFATAKERNTLSVLPRKVLCSVLYNKEEMKLKAIRDYMQYKTHTNIMYHLKSMEDLYTVDREFKAKVDRIYDVAYKVYYLNETI